MSTDNGMQNNDLPEIGKVLEDPAASFWLKAAIRSALVRDPVDAANDAELLSLLLARRCAEILADFGEPALGETPVRTKIPDS